MDTSTSLPSSTVPLDTQRALLHLLIDHIPDATVLEALTRLARPFAVRLPSAVPGDGQGPSLTSLGVWLMAVFLL